MGCVQSYFKRAHTAGLSPSSTQDSNSKTAAVEEEVKPIIAEEKSLTEEPESNDTSYGVEATAVRTLAASTGTVAILGTTAKTNGKNDDEEEDKQVKTIPEENEKQEENKTFSLEKAEVHKPSETEKNNINIGNIKSDILENSTIKDEQVEENNVSLTTQLPSSGNMPTIETQPANDKVNAKVEKEVLDQLSNENSRENSVLSRASDSSQNISSLSKAETVGESPITVVEVEKKVIEGSDVANGNNQEPTKDVEEDNSKSISSERLKTNSISDTTLSESYNAELENNSVKQSPSVEKVLESFDSSSTVEFVDVGIREATRSKRSIDEDLIDGSVSSTSLRSTSVDIINQNKENVLTPTEVPSVATEILSPTHENSISMLSTISDHTSPVKDELRTSTTEEASENNRSEERTSIQSENRLKETENISNTQEETPVPSVDSPFKEPTPVSAVVVSLIKPVQIEDNLNKESRAENDIVEVERSQSIAEKISPSVPKEVNQLEKDVPESNTNGFDLDEKLVSAATTIQASFRGYQTRQNLKTEEPETDSLVKELSSNSEEVSDQLNSAATTIQASFRGYQERKNIKTEETDDIQNKNEEFENVTEITTNQEEESNKDSIATEQNLKAEKSEKVSDDKESQINLREVSDEFNAAATTIQSNFRGFQARQNLKNTEVDKDTAETKDNTELSVESEIKDDLNNAATTIQATFRGFKARQNLKNEEPEKDIDVEESVKIENEDLNKLNSAATTIQSTFRGFQARQNVQNDNTEASKKEEKPLKDDVIAQELLNSETSVNVEENENNEQLVSAATTIQATFRGFQTRQNLKNPQSENNEKVEEPFVDNNQSNDELNSAATKIQANFRGFQTRKNIQNENADSKPEVEEPETVNTDQLGSAATTIQAAFRGFQTRQDLKRDQTVGDLEIEESLATLDEVIQAESANYNNSEDQEKPEENLENKEDEFSDKLNNAASTIQATFRGFQTRQNLKNSNLNQNEENINNNEESFDKKTPLSITPEILDSVKEEVNEICKQAIATTESILAGKKDVEKAIENEENVAAITLSINDKEEIKDTLDSVSDKLEVVTEESKDYLLDEPDDKLASAATTIQASFRGFQARQNLQKMVDTEEQPDSMPDYPPPALDDESLFGPSVADEDLPPPDFEALESSYSEDVPTEPLAPPPLDHDSLKFNEEDEFDEELQSLQNPQECDELPENRLTLESDTSTEIDSSMSSAATKIQAGVRGFLTRRQFDNIQKGTDSTSVPSIVDSDRSVGDFSGSHEEDGPVKSTISMEEESEICRHRNSPDKEDIFENNILDIKKRQGKRMSLGNSLHEVPPRQRKQRALSMQIHRDNATDEEIWSTLKCEMSSAATLIQSNYRGYRARKQLQREDAVQVQTSGSSQTTPAAGSIEVKEVEPHPTRSSGEYHDIIALTPPNIQKDKPPEES